MKKLLFILFGLVVLFAFVGCASLTPLEFEEPTIEVSVDGDDVANVTVIPFFEAYADPDVSSGTIGYKLNVENKTDSIIRIVWEKCAIYYGSNSSLVFITGQKYIDHNSPMAPTAIPAKGNNSTSIYAADSVYYISGSYGGWHMSKIPSLETKVLICIEANGKDTYYTFDVKGNPIYPPTEE